jgi:hypothetical protein
MFCHIDYQQLQTALHSLHRPPELLKIVPFVGAIGPVMTQGILEASDDFKLTPV